MIALITAITVYYFKHLRIVSVLRALFLVIPIDEVSRPISFEV